MTRRIVIGLLCAAACLCAAGTAGAVSLSYSGAVAPSDPSMDPSPFTSLDTSCGGFLGTSSLPTQPNYDAYAFRNTGSAACVDVQVIGPKFCTEGLAPTTYAGGFAPKAANQSIIGGNQSWGCTTSHQADVGPGYTFVVAVHGDAGTSAATPYTLNVDGASIVAANEVLVSGGGLPKGNSLTAYASSLKDGSAVTGTVAVSSAAGQSYSGSVTCLRVDGGRASLLMSITGGNAPTKFTGAAFWIEEDPSGNGGQRNSLLTAAQLARYGGVCPDPNAPLGGSLRAMTGGYASVIDTPSG